MHPFRKMIIREHDAEPAVNVAGNEPVCGSAWPNRTLAAEYNYRGRYASVGFVEGCKELAIRPSLGHAGQHEFSALVLAKHAHHAAQCPYLA